MVLDFKYLFHWSWTVILCYGGSICWLVCPFLSTSLNSSKQERDWACVAMICKSFFIYRKCSLQNSLLFTCYLL